jgi:hypothetical protein
LLNRQEACNISSYAEPRVEVFEKVAAYGWCPGVGYAEAAYPATAIV